mmetsp:Transcript_70999/g.154291  ORF Transcript_70999/g.154291 Transcript_70999/m.154291 type:complete len:328 (-) Transcript_70999:221-1204(-)
MGGRYPNLDWHRATVFELNRGNDLLGPSIDHLAKDVADINQKLFALAEVVASKAETVDVDLLKAQVRDIGVVRAQYQLELQSIKDSIVDDRANIEELNTRLRKQGESCLAYAESKFEGIETSLASLKTTCTILESDKLDQEEFVLLVKRMESLHDAVRLKADAKVADKLEGQVLKVTGGMSTKAEVADFEQLRRQLCSQCQDFAEDVQDMRSQLQKFRQTSEDKAARAALEVTELGLQLQDLSANVVATGSAAEMQVRVQALSNVVAAKADRGRCEDALNELNARYEALTGFLTHRSCYHAHPFKVTPPPGRPQSARRSTPRRPGPP